MATKNKIRLQAYLPQSLAELIKEKAQKAERPETWEMLRIIKLGLEADGETLPKEVCQ